MAFKFVHQLDGTTVVTSLASGDEFVYQTIAGPQSADAFMMSQVKEHLVEYQTEAPKRPVKEPTPPAPIEEEEETVEEETETGEKQQVRRKKGAKRGK